MDKLTSEPSPEKALKDDAASQEMDPRDGVPADVEYLSTQELCVLMVALLFVVLIMMLDISIIATAIPSITDHFHTVADIGWYGAAFSMAISSLQPLSGKVYTHFSMKHVFLSFIAIFEFGSLLCGVSVSSNMFIIGRTVSGMGAAGIMNGALSLVGTAAPPAKRPVMMGVIMGFAAAGQIAGPLIGGALTQHVSWRWCFFINLPVGAVTMLFIFLIQLPAKSVRHTGWTIKIFFHDLDVAGFLIFAPACVMLLLALEWGGVSFPWKSATVIGLLCGSVVTFFIFGLWERREGDNAMIPASILGKKVVCFACLTSFFQGGGMLLVTFYLPEWFQIVRQASPTQSAVHTIPTFVAQIVFAGLAGAFVPKLGYLAPVAVLGNALSAIGNGMISTFTPSVSRGAWIGYQVFAGAGRGMVLQIPVLIVQAAVPKAQLALGTAIVTWAQLLGSTIFLALGQTIFANDLQASLHSYVPALEAENPGIGAALIHAGATNYASVVPVEYLQGVVLAYNRALTRTFLLSAGAGAVAAVTAVGVGWKRLEVESKSKGKEPCGDA